MDLEEAAIVVRDFIEENISNARLAIDELQLIDREPFAKKVAEVIKKEQVFLRYELNKILVEFSMKDLSDTLNKKQNYVKL